LFAGAATDANAPVFFNGAMDVLQPKIDDGTLKVVSGQTTFDQVSTEGWKKEKAQERMENLITKYYSDGTPLAGVLSPNDQLAEGILNAANAAKLTPTVTGQDSEVVAVTRVAKGEQYSTIYKDTRKLVAQTVEMIKQICGGTVFPTTTTFKTDSGVEIPTYYLEPLIVTAENGAEVYKDNAELLAAFQAGQ
jgi:putative multiple sugar transport system substrate-binding protein